MGVARASRQKKDRSRWSRVVVRAQPTSRDGVPSRTVRDHQIIVPSTGGVNVQTTGLRPRSQVQVWLFSEPRFLGELEVDADGAVGDTDPMSTHGPAIGCLEAGVVVHGYPSGPYRPEVALSRGQAASMVARLLGLDTSGFDTSSPGTRTAPSGPGSWSPEHRRRRCSSGCPRMLTEDDRSSMTDS